MDDFYSPGRRRLPPLSALRAFEAAARHGSFKRAADELAVTPTAISHQVRSLEERTGLALFERRPRKVALTAAGADLYPVLRDAFDAFADTLERLSRRRERERVTISATTAFMARWLVPRIAAFHHRHPEIDLQLRASDAVISMSGSGVDIAIRYGRGPYPGYDVKTIVADVFAPVVNPILGVASSDDLSDVPLIAFEWRRPHPDNPTWARWFMAAGLDERAEPARFRYSDESHAVQAAVAGQGVALLSLTLVADELAAGHLVRPFGPTLPGHCYHVLTRQGVSPGSAVATVVAWLMETARAMMPPV